jgi:hypothetical protein
VPREAKYSLHKGRASPNASMVLDEDVVKSYSHNLLGLCNLSGTTSSAWTGSGGLCILLEDPSVTCEESANSVSGELALHSSTYEILRRDLVFSEK